MLNEKTYLELQDRIQYTFKDKTLLEMALTHTSFANENYKNKLLSNERLEFLGDAVLEIITSEYLYKRFKNLPEGKLTKLRSKIVCEPTLATYARRINLGEYLFFGKGEELTGGRERDSIISDAMEALIGAVYLDSNLEETKKLVSRLIFVNVREEGIDKLFTDYKTRLQEIIQSEGNRNLTYKIVDEKGPDHNKCFVVNVVCDRKVLGVGRGRNKKNAEQNAAKDALQKIG